jgi:hypothetical protein
LHVKVLTFSLTYLCYTFHKLSLVVWYCDSCLPTGIKYSYKL